MKEVRNQLHKARSVSDRRGIPKSHESGSEVAVSFSRLAPEARSAEFRGPGRHLLLQVAVPICISML
jgi:hypothetical protein